MEFDAHQTNGTKDNGEFCKQSRPLAKPGDFTPLTEQPRAGVVGVNEIFQQSSVEFVPGD
jgi:hypothetical protein